MGHAEQLDFFEEQDPKNAAEAAARPVEPGTDDSKFKFAAMKQAAGGEEPTPAETEEQRLQRQKNEKYVAQVKYANHRFSR